MRRPRRHAAVPDSLRDPLRDQIQTSLGSAYTLERELGGGGMSRVFVVDEIRLRRKLVVKVLSPELAAGVSAERFQREIELAASLQQANIVPLLAVGETDGLPYYTMPFVDGLSLRARLERNGALPVGEAMSVLRDVARALAYAHEHGVVHRDIKPDNILLSGGAAVVTDFGIAKAVSASRTLPRGGTLTRAGTSVGTPAYMAPEQAAGDEVDHRADLYAWGIVAWEMLAGRHPFAEHVTAGALIAAHVRDTPPPLTAIRPAVPAALAALVASCLSKDPAARPASAGELLGALDQVATPAEFAAGGRAPVRPRARRALAALALATLALAAAAAAAPWVLRARHAAPVEAMSLAVLPIENLSRDSSAEYLADGMTGELSRALSKLPGVQVAGELSTFRFKGTHVAPDDIARQLGVRMLLSGKLQPRPGRVRLQVQLADRDGRILWSNTYDRESRDAFAIQDEITSAVANEMRVVLSPATVAAARAGRTVSPEAHDFYLRGQFEKNKLTPDALERALVLFQDALKIDPNYAQAHAGVAFAYDLLADVYRPSHEYHMLSLAAARRAVEIDSLLAEARVLRGYEIAAATWDFAAGRAEMERGLAMNPNSPDGLFMYGMFCYLSGDIRKSVELADRLKRVDPLSPLAARLRAEALAWGGRAAEALREDSIARRLDSTVIIWESSAGLALLELGRLDEAAAAFQQFEKSFGQPSVGLAMTYGRMGRREDAMRVIRAIEAREREQWVEPTFVAIAYAAVGDRDEAMRWLETAYRKKTFNVRLFSEWDEPWMRDLKDDPRFQALTRRARATILRS